MVSSDRDKNWPAQRHLSKLVYKALQIYVHEFHVAVFSRNAQELSRNGPEDAIWHKIWKIRFRLTNIVVSSYSCYLYGLSNRIVYDNACKKTLEHFSISVSPLLIKITDVSCKILSYQVKRVLWTFSSSYVYTSVYRIYVLVSIATDGPAQTV